jgi:hypothetical protein
MDPPPILFRSPEKGRFTFPLLFHCRKKGGVKNYNYLLYILAEVHGNRTHF